MNEVLREVLAEALERVADTDDRLTLVTVTGVETSSDLSHATVYLSSLDEVSAGALAEVRGELQHAIGSQVRMKRTPHLHFVLDPAVVHGMRVEEILRRVHEEAEASAAAEPSGAAGASDVPAASAGAAGGEEASDASTAERTGRGGRDRAGAEREGDL